MDRSEFNNEIECLFEYFRFKVPSPKAVDLWFLDCEYIHSEIFLWSVRRIKDGYESIPRNLPAAIKALSFEYYKEFPHKIFEQTKYNKIKDDRYPIGKLYEGFEILEKYGERAFLNFCGKNRMPQSDRSAVLKKYQVSSAKKEKTINELTQNIGKGL